ncbi:hypothetical protein ACFRR7_18865 [Streptomyces sp. NPDC056909]|uniref:hypothetical protein n=1 Tax=Streptomyces sp. NPDC056909 TaxID=3345963 RepID=UPI0036C7438F
MFDAFAVDHADAASTDRNLAHVFRQSHAFLSALPAASVRCDRAENGSTGLAETAASPGLAAGALKELKVTAFKK